MYIDTSLIIAKLCDIAQHTDHGVENNSNQRAYETFGQNMFRYAVGLLPTTHPIFDDKAFIADRTDLTGSFDAEAMAKARPNTLGYFRAYLKMIEKDMLKGDKKFFLGASKPTIADIYVHFIVNWTVSGHKGNEPEVTRETFPKVFQWVDDVNAFLAQAPKAEKIPWTQAKEVLLAPPKHEFAKFVHHDEQNSLGLKKGQNVNVIPTDTGKSGPQAGELVSINDEQCCIRNKANLLMHFPRIGYSITPA